MYAYFQRMFRPHGSGVDGVNLYMHAAITTVYQVCTCLTKIELLLLLCIMIDYKRMYARTALSMAVIQEHTDLSLFIITSKSLI